MQHEITTAYLASQGFSKTFPRRFFEKVKITESCWLWSADIGNHGYGTISRGIFGGGNVLSHRASWILHFGPIPDGMQVLHDCPNGDRKDCVCPAHLWLGTHKENINDLIAKGGRPGPAVGIYHFGAKLTEDQVRSIRKIQARGRGVTKGVAAKYGILEGAVRDIWARRTWPTLA